MGWRWPKCQNSNENTLFQGNTYCLWARPVCVCAAVAVPITIPSNEMRHAYILNVSFTSSLSHSPFSLFLCHLHRCQLGWCVTDERESILRRIHVSNNYNDSCCLSPSPPAIPCHPMPSTGPIQCVRASTNVWLSYALYEIKINMGK